MCMMPKSLFFEIAPAPGKASGLVDSSRANAVERGVSLTVGACRRDAAGGLPPQPTEPVKQWARSNPRCIRLRKETHGLEPEKTQQISSSKGSIFRFHVPHYTCILHICRPRKTPSPPPLAVLKAVRHGSLMEYLGLGLLKSGFGYRCTPRTDGPDSENSDRDHAVRCAASRTSRERVSGAKGREDRIEDKPFCSTNS